MGVDNALQTLRKIEVIAEFANDGPVYVLLWKLPDPEVTKSVVYQGGLSRAFPKLILHFISFGAIQAQSEWLTFTFSRNS